jgi:hypothetical protein
MKIGDIQGIELETLKKVKGLGGTCLSKVLSKALDKGIMIIKDR